MREKTKKAVLTALYGMLVLSVAVIAAKGIAAGGAGYGQLFFVTFTVDSNLLCASVCCGSMFFLHRNAQAPAWLHTLALLGATGVSVTFTLVMIFLAPMAALNGSGWQGMFTGGMFHLHLLNPLTADAALVLSAKGYRFTRAQRAAALLPVLAYSVVYLLKVVVFGTWPDFYGFTFGGKPYMIPVSMAFMYALSIALTALLARICRGKTGTRKAAA